MGLNKDSYHLVFLLIGMYFLMSEKVGKILQKQISEQRVYWKVQSNQVVELVMAKLWNPRIEFHRYFPGIPKYVRALNITIIV